MVAPAEDAFEDGRDPLMAASRLNGRLDEELASPKDGGSIRENGAEIRLFDLIPASFRGGERPAGAVDGARGAEIEALVGVEKRDGKAEGGGIDFTEVKEKVNGFTGLSFTSLLLFLLGELKTSGSTFSLSKSSKTAGSKERLVPLTFASLNRPVVFCAVTAEAV